MTTPIIMVSSWKLTFEMVFFYAIDYVVGVSNAWLETF